MNLLRVLLLLALALTTFAGFAQEGWHDKDGNPIPDSPSSKSIDGFAAMLLVTPDKDWQAKWNTPPETMPHFSEASEVGAGGELYILTFLANPKLDDSGMANVTCDFIVTRPDGSRSVDEADMPCFVTKVATDPRSVYLSSASLMYVAEPTDPRGKWIVNATLRDHVRNVEIPLETSFTVK